MTSKIESTKRQMFIALAKLKAGGRWLLKKENADAFEAALEEHLEVTRQELQRLEWISNDNNIFRDAYWLQQKLTHEACCQERVLFDDLRESKRLLAMADSDCGFAQELVDQQKAQILSQKVLIESQRQVIGRMYMVKGTMSRQIRQLLEEIEVLKMANEVVGELLRGREVSVGYPVTMSLVEFNEKA